MSYLVSNKGHIVSIMPTPMGEADFVSGDFFAYDPIKNEKIPFSIEPDGDVELTVINMYNQEITRTFRAGINPFMIWGIKQDAAETTIVQYHI